MHLFQNALAMDPQNISTLVLMMAAVAWAGTLIVLLSDLIADEKLAVGWKFLWFPVLVLLPAVGGLLYSSVSLIRSLAGAKQKS